MKLTSLHYLIFFLLVIASAGIIIGIHMTREVTTGEHFVWGKPADILNAMDGRE